MRQNSCYYCSNDLDFVTNFLDEEYFECPQCYSIETRRTTLNRSNSAELNQFNTMVERYNNMLAEQREITHRYNAIVTSYNRMNIGTQVISSIGGGISLEPHKFKKPVLDSNSPKIRTIKTIKPQLTPRGSISESDDWIRSNP